MSHKYVLDNGWRIVFADAGIPAQDVLRLARLPLDLLTRKSPTISAEEYFRIWEALAYIVRDEPAAPLRLAQMIKPEAFSPPIFACFCSDNLNVAANRLSYYKPLVGPMRLHITRTQQRTTIAFAGLPENDELPHTLIAGELVFWVHITRLATREQIVPAAVHTTLDIPAVAEYEAYFGTRVQRDDFNGVSFRAQDAAKPFLTANDAMWSIFEPQLNKRMKDLEQAASVRDKVRACLMEILASGRYSMADVASKLAVSPRTLQRHLREEGTTFQKELDALREELARNYLKKSDYTSGQIAFLLGYEDPNSFFRAFRSWTGQTPEIVRESIQ